MNYRKIYDLLIERAKTRVLDCYQEKHHIIPRCLGGGDEKENLVKLMPREHYFAHQLLVKIHPEVVGLWYAVHCMSKRGVLGKYSSRHYEWICRGRSKKQSIARKGKPRSKQAMSGLARTWGLPKSESHKAALAAANRGKKLSEETKKKLSEIRKGRIVSEETRAKLSVIRKGKKTGLTNKSRTGMQNSPETRRKISEANTGKLHIEEWKKNISLGQAKISDEVIRAIRKEYDSGSSIISITNKFGISRTHTGRIAKRQTYLWVDD